MSDEDRMESSQEEEEEDEDEGQGLNMMNFMFGNVDSHGELEGDFLDEEAKQSLGGLQNVRAGLDISDLAENGPVDKASAPKAAAKKGAQQAVDTIGESDISDDEDWPTDPAEAAKPPTTTAAAAASFTPSNLATLGQPTFQDEDDYDADEDAAPPSVAVSQAVPGVTQSAATLLPSSAALPGSSSLQAGIGAAQKVPAQPGAASVPSGAAAPAPAPPAELPQTSTQPAVPNVQQGVRRKTASLQQQVDQAQAAGVVFPIMITSDGRPVLRYSDLIQKGTTHGADAVTEASLDAAVAARQRAERLNALKAQTAAAAASSASAATSAPVTKAADDSDDEGFLHATAVGKLPEHLRRSDSQDSDSDVLVSGQEEEEQHSAELVHKSKQEGRRDNQAASKALPRKQKGIRQMPSGLPLTQAVDQTIFLEIPETDLDSIHTIQWERDIIWDDPDESHDAVAELRSNRQGGNTPGHEGSWDDLDQALEMDLDPLSAKTYVWQRPVPVLEPLSNHKGAGSAASKQHERTHPQMLRLDQLIIEDQQQSAEGQDPAAAAGLPHLKKALKAQKARLLPFSSQLKADDWLLAMELEESSGALAVGPPPALLLDLNDPKMTFEVLRGTEAEEYANAAATVLPAMPKVQPDMVHPVVFSSAGAIMARLNISKDAIYFPAGKRKGDKLGSASRLHTLQASNMTTIPLQNDRQRPELFHRPLGLWNPLISKKLHVKNQSKLQIDEMLVKISSLVGAYPKWHSGEPLTISLKKIAAAETVKALWDKAKQDKFKAVVIKDSAGNALDEHVPLLVDRRNPSKLLDFDASLQEAVLKEPVLEFAAIFSNIKLLPTAVANAVPSHTSGAALAPPAAFQRRKDLTAAEGHVVLLEYFEEFPLFLSHPGMGAKLTTYYRRKSPADNDHMRLMKEHDKWRVGKVEPLQTQEDSPFIGQLDPGKHQLAIETGMYRAPAFPYSAPPTDFLLIRNATGAISLRELTGCVVVGQEVPAMRAPIPHSRDVREIEGARLVVYVVRDLRNKQLRAEKAEAKSGKYLAPKVHFKELKQLFPYISDTTVRYRLKDKCECMPVKQDDPDGFWQPKPGARLPSEAELRRMLSPDQWCVFDSTVAGEHRLYEQGITKHEALSAIPPERLQLVMEQLPEEKQAAAKYLDLALKTTPWTLTDNYVSRERENRGAQMAFAGPGDPTGKGRGFSFVKDTRKSMGNQAAKQKEGKLTGTAADLRRLKVPALKDKLRAAGVPENVLQNVRRWELVDLLREVANIGEGSSEFARNQRMSAAEMMQRKTRLCQEIWQRQVAVLSNISDQPQPGDSASEDDIGEELQACLAGNEEAESAPAKPAKEAPGLNEAQQAAEDEEALRAMREEGMLAGQPDAALPQAAVPKKKLEAEPGARRMRRKVTYTHPDGQVVVKEIIYSQDKDQDKVVALNAIYGVEAWNFGSRTIKGRIGKNRTLDKTASQIKAEPAAAAVAAENALGTEPAAAVDLTDLPVASPIRRVPSRKSGAGAKGAKKLGTAQICRDCQQPGHLTKKNKKCPMYVEEEPEPLAPWLPDLQLPNTAMQDVGYEQAAPLHSPPKPTQTLKLRINPSPKASPAAPPPIRPPPPQEQPPSQPVFQQPHPSQHVQHQTDAQTAPDPVMQQQMQRAELPQQWPDDSQQQLAKQQSQVPKLKRQKRDVAQGEALQPQLQPPAERRSLKVKLGGSLKRKDSVAESTASASAPKKIKLSVKLTNPSADHAQAAASPLDQPYAESSAAANRPRAFEPSEVGPERPESESSRAPGCVRAPEPGAVAPGPKASEQPARSAGRSRPSEPARPAPNRSGPPGLAMDEEHQRAAERRPASAGAHPRAAPPDNLPAQALPPARAVPKMKGESGKKILAKILTQILNGAKKIPSMTKLWWDIFSNPVNKKSVIDYNKFILPEDEMWIKKITGKLIKSGYTSHKQFKADLHQLMTNAQTYNGSEGGVCAYPLAIPIATDIYDHCVAGLEAYSDEIQEAEQKIVQEGAT